MALTVDRLLEESRSKISRVHPEDLQFEVARGALVVDIRPVEQRQEFGEMLDAIVIDRNVLEWRLAPSSSARILDLSDGRTTIIVCQEGFASSLAAATLRSLGVPGATDLAGGYQAWRALP